MLREDFEPRPIRSEGPMKRRSIGVAVLLLLFVSSLSFSQSRETGAITGKVTDEQGAPLPGVNLTLSGEKLMGARTTVSDANGDFRYPALPPGTYSLQAELARAPSSRKRSEHYGHPDSDFRETGDGPRGHGPRRR
jgi:hypothetical protein